MDYTTNKLVAPVLPVEITYQILLLLCPHELIHLQTVSKQFHAIINDSTFWRTMYAGAQLPRPPGPFLWQSTDFLRRTLVRSAQLAQRWTSQPMRILQRHSLPVESRDDCMWACGRWLILRRTTRQLVSHDVDTGFEHTLYEFDWGSHCIDWSATCCPTSSRGGLLYVVLCIGAGLPTGSMKLLEFRVDDDSRNLSEPISCDVSMRFQVNYPSLQVESGNAPFLFISAHSMPWGARHSLVFDIRTRIFYGFPQSGYRDSVGPKVVLTTTHIILYHGKPHNVIEAYVIPDDKETNELRLTHATTFDNDRMEPRWWVSLRNPVVDPITGSTHLRFLVHTSYHSDPFRFRCFDITLPANSTENVLPLLLDAHVVTMSSLLCNQIVGTELIQASADGFARGLGHDFRLESSEPRMSTFSIDATGERCMLVIGPTWSPTSVAGDERSWSRATFDGTSGRLCLPIDNRYSTENYPAEVLDIG